MQINNLSSTNFQGGFRLQNLSPEVQAKVPNIVNKHRQIFNNFERQGDIFLSVRDGADFKVANFIKKHKIAFEYYPNINTKSKLDNERPWELTNLIAITQEAPIKTLGSLKNFLVKKSLPFSY